MAWLLLVGSGHFTVRPRQPADVIGPLCNVRSMSTVSSGFQTVEFAGVSGIKLVADEWNRDADTARRPSILMLHGGGQNRHSWKNTGQILADSGYHVVALDSRGHGDSDRAPHGDYDIETLTADVIRVL